MVSVDELEGQNETLKTYEVPFPLLSDPEAKVHEQFKVANDLNKGEKGHEWLKTKGIDVERWSKRKHHKVAIPSIFLIDQDLVVRFAHAAHDYKTRPKTEALVEKLKEIVDKK